MSVRRFNGDISKYENAVVLCASVDLPFAHARFCGAEGLKDVISVSELRNKNFGNNYGGSHCRWSLSRTIGKGRGYH